MSSSPIHDPPITNVQQLQRRPRLTRDYPKAPRSHSPSDGPISLHKMLSQPALHVTHENFVQLKRPYKNFFFFRNSKIHSSFRQFLSVTSWRQETCRHVLRPFNKRSSTFSLEHEVPAFSALTPRRGKVLGMAHLSRREGKTLVPATLCTAWTRAHARAKKREPAASKGASLHVATGHVAQVRQGLI